MLPYHCTAAKVKDDTVAVLACCAWACHALCTKSVWLQVMLFAMCNSSLATPSMCCHAGPLIMVPRPLPSVLIIHTGGTLGMDPVASYEPGVDGREKLKRGGSFSGTLGPGRAPVAIANSYDEPSMPSVRQAMLTLHVSFTGMSCHVCFV